MTESNFKSWSQLLRSFVAWPLPFLLLLVIALAAPKEFSEPVFVQGWSAEAKALGLFTLMMMIFALLPVVLGLWAKRVDPTTSTDALGRRPIEMFLDNVGTHASMSAVIAFAAYAKDLKHISTWWMAFAIVVFGLAPLLASIYRQMKRGGDKP